MLLTEVERAIVGMVVQWFLKHDRPIQRRRLLDEFGATVQDCLHRLAMSSVLRFTDDKLAVLPRAVAFHLCGDAYSVHFARKSTTTVLRVLRDIFEQESKAGEQEKDCTPDDVESRVRETRKAIEPNLITVGLYLAEELEVFRSLNWDGVIRLHSFRISEQIHTIGDIDVAWDEYIRRCRVLVERTSEKMQNGTSAIVTCIDELRKELAEICQLPKSDPNFKDAKLGTWSTRVYEQLKSRGFSKEAEQGFGPNSITNMYESADERAKRRDNSLKALRDDIASHPEHYEARISSSGESSRTEVLRKPHKLFLGHGHDKLWARVHMYLKDELDLDVEAWESTARAGFHSVEVLKNLLNSCTFAVIVATGDDSTIDGEVRARQNVVHEIGLFQGQLGFSKVALLKQEGIEEFSNLAGLQVIPFQDGRIEAAFYELQRMLKRERVLD